MPGEVSIRQEPLTIPTYPVGEPERCPMFYCGRGYQGAKGPVYPYPLLDRLSDVREDRTYGAIYLENPYLQLCVLPEIGGRIFWGLDKTNSYDFLYRQHVIKPALIGMLGAWISGGVEWDIPHHHRPTTFMPVDWCVVAGDGGAKTLWLGEIERRHRMKWIVGLTLYPDRSYLEVTIRLFNRTPYAHSFLCFTNLAVHVNDSYQVIFPPATQWGTQHAKCEFIRWPLADGVYGGVDYSAGVDVSWWKNHPSPLSIFAFDSPEDFFGGYDHGREAGIVHVADHHTVPGKKFFTFGNGPAGRMWDKILTDSDGPYLELMAGAYSDNQPDYSWIQPYETKTVIEYWYPVRNLGGIKNANRDAAVNLDADARRACRLAFNTTRDIDAATVLLRAGEQILLREEVRIGPANPFRKELPLPRGAQLEDLHASLLLPSGQELISYRPAPRKVEPMPHPVEPPPTPDKIASNEDLYLAGLRLEQFHSPAAEPEPYYQEALRRDPGDIRANTALGILCLKRGMFEPAERHLRTAVDRLTRDHTRPRDTEALYYLALARKAQGRTDDARDALHRAAWGHAWRGASAQVLAEMACRQGDWANAMTSVEEAFSYNAASPRATDLKAVLLRKTGRLDEALATASRSLDLDPLDAWARNERVLALLAAGRHEEARRESDLLAALMQDAEACLELACDYEGCGLWEEAFDVLTRRGRSPGPWPDNPMVHYAMGFYLEKMGRRQQALDEYRTASRMRADYAFPFRLETAEWLRAAIARNPADSRAYYYLGNLLYDLQPDAAVHAWEQSRRLDDGFWLAHRNLGFAHGRADNDRSRAIACYRRAIECNGREPRLFLELDQLLEAAGAPAAERLSLLERNGDVVRQRDDALLRQIVLHVLVGQYDRAIERLDGRHFHIWEGGEHTVHDVYVDAHLLKGRGLSAAGRHRQALAEYLLATEYPDRFEVGEPYDGGRAAQVWYHVGLAHEALGEADQARAAFERAVRQARPDTDLPFFQGLAWRKLHQEAKALACFTKVEHLGRDMLSGAARDFFEKFGVRRRPSDRQAQAHYLLGCGALGNGDASTARQEFEQAVRLSPNHLWARTLLSSLSSGSGGTR
jgi:tetratricopeptide (TPR) repeat protein